VTSYLYNGGIGYQPIQLTPPPAAAAPVAKAPPKDWSDEQLDRLLDKLEARMAARSNVGNGAPKSLPPRATSPTDDNAVVGILSRKLGNAQKACVDCHTGAGAKGGVRIFDAPGVVNPNVDWFKVWDAADSGRMPPEVKSNVNAALGDEECNILRAKIRR
jgi:hypothetical protein